MSRQPQPISAITTLVTKGTTPTTLGRPFTDEGVTFVKAEALNGDSGLEVTGFSHIDEDTHELLARSRLEEGDVLVTIAGAHVGRCGYVKADHLPANTNQAVGIVRMDKSIALPRYIYYFFKQPSTFALCQSLGGQAAQPNVNLTVLKSIEVPLPTLGTQQAIADILSAYDDLIENNRRRMALLEEAVRQLYREWFVCLRFPGHEHTGIINGVPEGWESKCLGEWVQIKKGKNITKETVEEGTVPVVAGGLEPAYFHSAANAKGPVVTVSASGANAGYVNIYLQDVWASDCSYISVEWTSDVYYFYCLLKYMQQELFALQNGAAQPHVYPKDVQRLSTVSPPKRLLQYFAGTVEPHFELIANLTTQNHHLRAARNLLLPRLMRGEVAV